MPRGQSRITSLTLSRLRNFVLIRHILIIEALHENINLNPSLALKILNGTYPHEGMSDERRLARDIQVIEANFSLHYEFARYDRSRESSPEGDCCR